MIKIKVTSIDRNIKLPESQNEYPSGYITVNAIFNFAVPEVFDIMPNKVLLVESYRNLFSIETLINDVVSFTAKVSTPIFKDNSPINGWTDETDIINLLENEYAVYGAKLAAFQPFPFDSIIGKELIETTWDYPTITP